MVSVKSLLAGALVDGSREINDSMIQEDDNAS